MKNILATAAAAFLLVTSTGCSGFLDEELKSSLAPEGKSIAFKLDKNKGFEWIGEYDVSADDLLSGSNRGQKTSEAKEFLKEILEFGAVAQKKIIEEAESQGIKKRTLCNVKSELNIESEKIGNQWFWSLPTE